MAAELDPILLDDYLPNASVPDWNTVSISSILFSLFVLITQGPRAESANDGLVRSGLSHIPQYSILAGRSWVGPAFPPAHFPGFSYFFRGDATGRITYTGGRANYISTVPINSWSFGYPSSYCTG